MASVDFTQVLQDLEGEPIKADEGRELTLERVAVSAMLQPVKDDDGDKKYKKYGLIKKIHGSKEPVNLKAEEVSTIKRAIGESGFTALIVGQAWDLLEGEPKKTEKG